MTSKERFIYFMKPVGFPGPIKIGFSNDPMKRLKSCATWSPIRLQVIATADGDRTIERQLHNHFADIHSHGEWFHPHERLLTAIKAIKAGATVAEAVDLSEKRGNILAKAQMATKIKNGTVRKPTYQKVMDWLDEQERSQESAA
jgi:hypothetical protein